MGVHEIPPGRERRKAKKDSMRRGRKQEDKGKKGTQRGCEKAGSKPRRMRVAEAKGGAGFLRRRQMLQRDGIRNEESGQFQQRQDLGNQADTLTCHPGGRDAQSCFSSGTYVHDQPARD